MLEPDVMKVKSGFLGEGRPLLVALYPAQIETLLPIFNRMSAIPVIKKSKDAFLCN